MSVRTKRAEDGGRQYGDEEIAGIVLGVHDEVDEDGVIGGRVFDVLDYRSCGGDAARAQVIVRQLPEATLDLDGAGPASQRELRTMRRRLHRFIAARSYRKGGASPPVDSVELEAERVIHILLSVEVGR